MSSSTVIRIGRYATPQATASISIDQYALPLAVGSKRIMGGIAALTPIDVLDIKSK